MKVAFRVAVVMLSASVLQYGVLSQLPVFGVRADLLLLLAIAGGLALGPDRGAVVGFVAGLTYDLFLQSPLGLRALVFCVVGFIAGRYQLSVTRSSRRRLMLTMFVGSAMAYGLLVVVGWVLGQKNMLTEHLVAIIVVVAAFNAVFAPVAVRVLRWAGDEQTRSMGVSYGH